MGCDALAAMEHLDRVGGVAGPQLLAYQRVRHRVVMLVDLHVIVDAGAALLHSANIYSVGGSDLSLERSSSSNSERRLAPR